MALTAKRIAALRSKPGRYLDGGDHGQSLYLQVTANGASWLLRYERSGRERWHGLGSLKNFGLKEARLRARAKRQMLANGIDPIEAKRSAKKARALADAKSVTFETAAKRYFDGNAKKWGRVSAHQFMSSLKRHVFPKIGAFPVSEIDTGLVLSVLEPIWPTLTTTASRLRWRIENVLDWSVVRELRASGDNPARWSGHLENVLPAKNEIAKVIHHKAVPYKELPALMHQLRQDNGLTARALEFCILNASRTEEVLGATWSEIDFEEASWIIPGARMKGRRLHKVPLSVRSIGILKDLPRLDNCRHIFMANHKGGGLGAQTLLQQLRKFRQHETVHGFRSSFRNWAEEQTSYSKHACEMSLAHTIGGVEGVYLSSDLFDKRRRLMSDWADYCASAAISDVADNVVAIRSGS